MLTPRLHHVLAIATSSLLLVGLGWAIWPADARQVTAQLAAAGQQVLPPPDGRPVAAPGQWPASNEGATGWEDRQQRQQWLAAVAAGKRSLAPLLREARRFCREGQHCANWPEADLADMDAATASQLRKAAQGFALAEKAVQAVVMPSGSKLADIDAALRAARRNVLDEGSAQLLYGEEEAQIRLRVALEQQVARHETASLSQKLANYETLRRESYGPFYAQLAEGSNPYQRAEEVLPYILDGIAVADQPAVRQALLEALLPASEAKALAAQAEKDTATRQQQAQYQNEVARIRQTLRQQGDPTTNPQLAAEEARQLEDLRRRLFPQT